MQYMNSKEIMITSLVISMKSKLTTAFGKMSTLDENK